MSDKSKFEDQLESLPDDQFAKAAALVDAERAKRGAPTTAPHRMGSYEFENWVGDEIAKAERNG